MKNQIEFNSSGNKLVGNLYLPDGEEKTALLMLAGGANIPHNEGWYPEVQQSLSEKGITSLAFDFTGVGQSEGTFQETTLNTRIKDAHNAFKLLQERTNAKKIYVMGISMGAPVAISLLTNFEIDGLVLLVPAAYSLEARTKLFGPEFSEAIRKPENWKDSPEFKDLVQFKGKVLFAHGSQDEVIPEDIYNTYSKIVSDKGQELIFQSIGHRFMRESDEVSIEAREKLQEALFSFLLE